MTKGKETKWGNWTSKQVSFQVFPEGYDRGTVSYLERESIQENCGIVTERV